MKGYRIVAAMAALGALACGGNAAAAVYTITYSGKVTAGQDYQLYSGVESFFHVNGDLAGYDFTAVFTVDTAKPGAVVHDGPGAQSYTAGYGATSPVAATLTINGYTADFSDYLGQQVEDATTPTHLVISEASNSHHSIDCPVASSCVEVSREDDLYAYVLTDDSAIDGDFRTTPTALSASDITYQNFHFSMYAYSHQYGPTYDFYDFAYAASGVLDIRSVSITGGAPETSGGPAGPGVPEPASWALMILGFLGAGAQFRRRGVRA